MSDQSREVPPSGQKTGSVVDDELDCQQGDADALEAFLEEQARELLRRFPELDQPAVAKLAARRFADIIVPRPPRGAPRKETLDRAERMRAAGVSWRKVYSEVGAQTSDARNTLRNSLRQRQRRAVHRAEFKAL